PPRGPGTGGRCRPGTRPGSCPSRSAPRSACRGRPRSPPPRLPGAAADRPGSASRTRAARRGGKERGPCVHGSERAFAGKPLHDGAARARTGVMDDRMLRCSHVLCTVDDIARAVADYTELGFTVEWGSDPRQAHNALIWFAEGPFIELAH